MPITVDRVVAKATVVYAAGRCQEESIIRNENRSMSLSIHTADQAIAERSAIGRSKRGPKSQFPRTTVWLEAEQFADYGGWFNDSQFMDVMGSPYLLATGVGKPVQDAVTKFEVQQSGRYRLWVRCKDWFPSHSPGKFQVLVNGVASPIVFGQAGDAVWRWINGGEFELSPGMTEVRLHDLTGWWARCDAVVLSADTRFLPANPLDELARQREFYGSISREAQLVGTFDVVVVGGGMAGTAAAVTAARHGSRVVLLQNRPILGGNGSTEIQVPPLGDLTYEPWDPREIGLIEEFDPRTAGHGPWSANLERVARAEPNLQLWLNVHLTNVEMENAAHIRAVEAVHTQTGQRYRFEGGLFVDCTGDAWVGYHAGAAYRHGQEAKSEYGELAAPEVADSRTMCSSLNAGRFKGHHEPIAFDHPPWAYRWNSWEEFESRSTGAVWNKGFRVASFDNVKPGKGRRPQNAKAPIHEWYIEFGGCYDTIADAEFIRDELFRISIGVWDYVKNRHPEYSQSNARRELIWLNPVAGKRESRRLLSEFVLTQNDIHDHVIHPDIVAYAGWVMDLHHPCGFFTPGPQAHLEYLYRSSIPFRCLFSRNIENLMMAGRNISATHLALAKTRVQRTCTLTGWAAGLGAAIAVRHGISPRDVVPEYIDELQQTLLREGGYLPGVVNTDPCDLARRATVTASSFATIRESKYLVALDQYYWDGEHPLDHRALAVQFRAQADRIERVSLYLRSDRPHPTPTTLTLRPSRWIGEMLSTTDLATADAIVPPNFHGWVEFPLKYRTEAGGCYYMWLPQTKGLNWELYKYHPPDTRRAYATPPGWSCKWGCFKFKLHPGGEPAASKYIAEHGMCIEFRPENLLSGIARVVDGAPNSWAPDPELPLPQWIELAFEEPVEFRQIHVSFQMDILAPSTYSFQVPFGSEWLTILRVTNNRSRRRVHIVDPVTTTRLRLVLEKRRKAVEVPLTPVCEIRLYKET
jgi:hypothetical protein